MAIQLPPNAVCESHAARLDAGTQAQRISIALSLLDVLLVHPVVLGHMQKDENGLYNSDDAGPVLQGIADRHGGLCCFLSPEDFNRATHNLTPKGGS